MILVNKKLTYRDYILFPFDGKRHELIDGEHYMSPAPEYIHQKISRELAYEFQKYFKENDNGEVLYAPVDVYLSDFDLVQPDLIIISDKNKNIIKEKYIAGPPDIIIEILSPSNRNYDLILKKDLYEKQKINEYWIVDCDLKIIQLYKLENGSYIDAGIFKEYIESSLFSDMKINLKEVFK